MNDEKEKQAEQEEEKPRKKDSKLFLVSILIIIGIVAGIIIWRIAIPTGKVTTIDDLHALNLEGKLSEDKGYIYNGFSFVYYDGMWYTQSRIGNTLLNVPLHFGPRDLENITVKGKIDDRFKQKRIYITFDPEDPNMQYLALSASELSLFLALGLDLEPKAACTKNVTEACANRPILNCSNKKKAIIYLNQDNETAVELKGNCIEVKGDKMNLVRAVDRLILKWLGIMP